MISPKKPDLLIKGGQVVTLRGKKVPVVGSDLEDLGVIPDGCVLCDSTGRIMAVGSYSDMSSQFSLSKVTTLEVQNRVLLPGFVDSHAHPVFSGSRTEEFQMRAKGATYMEIHEKGGGILHTVRETREAAGETLRELARARIQAMFRHGSTTVEAKSGYGLTTESEEKCLDVLRDLSEELPVEIVPTFMGAHAIPPEYESSPEEFVDLVVSEMIPQVAVKAEFCDVFCEKGAFTPEQSRRILEAGKRYGLSPRIHAEEFSDQGGAALAVEVGALSADHLLEIGDSGIVSLAQSGTVATLLPGTPFFLGMDRYAPAMKLLERGVPVALATDFNAGSCLGLSMQMVISLACLRMKMPVEAALIGATLNGAYTLARSDRLGSIEVGKQADIIILDVLDYREMPYVFGCNLVKSVIKNGKIMDFDHDRRFAHV
ncbi:MAG: imidazolonepropionase [Armatimonadetes bacterium]|nr:imidazolonepropionase [Armatimonadota bacterium]